MLGQHPLVSDCAAVASGTPGGDSRLIAYVVPAPGRAEPTGRELHAFLAARLPAYMVPQAWVALEALPVTSNGKLDRKALREEGYRVILVNSNPATIMTDPEMADATYIEPITPEVLTTIIAKERPDALLPTLGGQTDKEAVAQQASMMTEMASGMALSTELARLEGDAIVSTLHYADDKVDFNGKQMTVEEFVAMAFASGAGLGMGGAAMGAEDPAMQELQLEEDESVEEQVPVE